MPSYRRCFVPGGTYFFTCVTHDRMPILTTELGRRCLRNAVKTVQRDYPFRIVAIATLPDHWLTVWTLHPGDDRYPLRWMRIKGEFTESWLACGGRESWQSMSRRNHGQRGIWQKQYWEHTVKDGDDLKRCVDYVHWNPRRHKLVSRVRDWPWSSFHRFVLEGEYDIDWGGTDPTPGWDAPEWGE